MKVRTAVIGALAAAVVAIPSPASADPTICVWTDYPNAPDACVPCYGGPVTCVTVNGVRVCFVKLVA